MLVIIFLCIYAIGRLYPLYSATSRSLSQKQLDNINAWERQLEAVRKNAYNESAEVKALDPIEYEDPIRFNFNPNTLSVDSLRLLGIPSRAIKNLKRYLDKGGAIRKPEDLKKVYGIPPALADDLLGYVRIPQSDGQKGNFGDKKVYAKDSTREIGKLDTAFQKPNAPQSNSSKEIKTISVAFIDINAADKYQWMQLNGIGEKRADAIVKYREALGGFYSIEQVKDVFIIPDSVYYFIEPNLQIHTPHKKIPINTIELDSLSKHPLFRYRDAKIIVAYRSNHGSFNGEEDFRKIRAFNSDFFDKVLPYMDFESAR